MARDERNGRRVERGLKRRVPSLGYYMIVADTEKTEANFFNGFRDSIPPRLRDRLVVKVKHASTCDLVDEAIRLRAADPQYREVWIILDRDRNTKFDEIINRAAQNDIKVGWSNPCFEIWIMAYFGEMCNIYESKPCCDKFGEIFKKHTGLKYDKAMPDLYGKLNKYGDEREAIKRAANKLSCCERAGKIKPSEMCPATTVHLLVDELSGKIHNN